MNSDDNQKRAVSAKEQRGVLMDLVNWLRSDGVLPANTKVTLTDLDTAPNTMSIIPLKGIIRSKSYACGGYEVYLPFALYYRTAAESNNDTDAVFQLLDGIGERLDAHDPPLELTDSREVIECYQLNTAVKYQQNGAMGDFMAEFALVYSRDD